MIGQRGCHHFYGIKSVCWQSLQKQKQDAASWLRLNKLLLLVLELIKQIRSYKLLIKGNF